MNTIDNKTAAMIAIAAEKTDAKSACISDETMAAFIDQRLDDAERSAVIQHLNACNDCLHRCTGVTAAVSVKQTSFLSKKWPVLATACILLICLCIPAMKLLNSPSYIENAYTDVSGVISENNTDMAPVFSLPWEKKGSSYGFNSGIRLTDPGKAFLSGMYSGKNRIYPDSITLPEFLKSDIDNIESSWAKTPWGANFKLGKWCYLMKVISEKQLDMDNKFSDKQAGYLSEVIREMKNQPVVREKVKLKLALTRMKKLQHYFETASKSTGIKKWGRLERETDILIHLMHF